MLLNHIICTKLDVVQKKRNNNKKVRKEKGNLAILALTKGGAIKSSQFEVLNESFDGDCTLDLSNNNDRIKEFNMVGHMDQGRKI